MRFGWTLQGCQASRTIQHRLNIHTCDCQKQYDELHGTVKEFFAMECPKPTQLLSQDDEKAVIGKGGVCGVIAEMFHRVNIREGDMHAQSFLWYDEGDQARYPSIYVMRAMTFGLNCAPCIALFIRDKNADDFKDQFPRAVEPIKKSHYVDDLIESADDEKSALELANQIKQIHAAAVFQIRGWSSNLTSVLEKLEEDPITTAKTKEWGSATKVLSMSWDPLNDSFKYICRFTKLRRDVVNESLIPTKREILQVLMSIFDPLGFVSCYTIGLKIILQEVWRAGIAWDEPLRDDLNNKWCQWKNVMQLIRDVDISRCFSPLLRDAQDVQLHTFVDAGEGGYAAVCYLRVKRDDDVTVSLVAAKTKVAPLKPLSIPRLEFQAAVIGTRLADMVTSVQRIPIKSKHWWTDSITVLRWIRMDPKRFHQFVMHRVGEILEASNVNQWRWVPSKANPADVATKFTTRSNYRLWFTGPDFLVLDQKAWPQCDEMSVNTIKVPELRNFVLRIDGLQLQKITVNAEYFSNWKRLYRAVATFALYVNRLQSLIRGARSKKITIDFEDTKRAQSFLVKYAQSTEFSEEISYLQR
ncbi:PREDICTED: uncharacterized protein LOC108372336, partial [Rhagoletis zephyria]|uniref:uncharacterized protein LOC108372336 n=1 Tax=Rhagoletis zephyria TaxID=28612 RepID=UPI000811542B